MEWKFYETQLFHVNDKKLREIKLSIQLGQEIAPYKS